MTTLLQPTTILIVEDSKSQADQLCFLLEKHGFFVRIAYDGKEALNSIRSEPPHW